MGRFTDFLALLGVSLTTFITCSFAQESSQHLEITNELIKMVENDDSLKNMLIQSIAIAKKINPDKKTNPAQTLEEYYDFVDWAAKALPWTIERDSSYTSLYDQIDQSGDYFYFINDQPLPELKNKGYYNNSLQYHEPYRSWMILFTKEWGDFLSTDESWNDEYLKKAERDPKFGLQKGWYEDPSHWKTFNEFFARQLKSPDERPIASPDDPSVVASPVDSVPQGVWKIDSQSNIQLGVKVKSKTYESVANLLGPKSAYKEAFAGGTLTHTFLDVNDYHRYHFPIAGTIKEALIIEQDDAAGGITVWDAKLKRYMLYSRTPGWESIETRGCVILETEEYGLVALLPVGMSQISSVNFEQVVQVGATVKKGDMLGYFLFGGSDFMILFQKQVRFDLTAPKKDKSYAHILMGEKYGTISLKGSRS